MRFDRLRLLVWLVSLLGVGCAPFDSSFFEALNPDGGGGGGQDGDVGGVDAGPPGLVDFCSSPGMTTLNSSNQYFEVTTDGLTNRLDGFESCFDTTAAGTEGFAALDVQAGERWHFHVQALNDPRTEPVQNPVLYLVRNCDERDCNPQNALNLCGDNGDEHFTFEAPQSGEWFLGLDDENAVSGRYNLLAIKTICGNDIPEHNESCEDGNNDDGDGCDRACRHEISMANPNEKEVNDDWTTANVLPIPATGGRASVKGKIGGSCGLDLFAFRVPQGGDVNVALRKFDGDACSGDPADVASVTMQLLTSDGRTSIGDGQSDATNACPQIDGLAFAVSLEAGTYYVRLGGDETAKVFDYELEVKVDP